MSTETTRLIRDVENGGGGGGGVWRWGKRETERVVRPTAPLKGGVN